MNLPQHIIQRLAEECLEVAHRCSKANIFGLDEIQYDVKDNPANLNNSERIVYELHDLMALIEMAVAHGLITYPNDRDVIELKKKKVLKHLDYCREIGTLNE